MNRTKYAKTIKRGAIYRQMYAARTASLAMANALHDACYTDAFVLEMQRQAARDYANARDWMGIIEADYSECDATPAARGLDL